MPLSHLTPSYRAHLTLMLCGLLAAAGIVFFLVTGWRWHFYGVERRQELARLSEKADQRHAEVAAQRAPGFHDATSATTINRSSEGLLPTAQGTGGRADRSSQSKDDRFPDPKPLTHDVAPDRMTEAMATLRRFSTAAIWQDKLPCVVDAERVRPLMQSYYETQANRERDVGEVKPSAHFKLNNTEVLLFSGPGSKEGGALELALVAPVGGGRFLVDWESFVGASEMSWPDFKKQRPNSTQMFRLFARRDDYFNYEFADSARYLSFNLTSPDGLTFIFGYCEKDSAQGGTLAGLLGKNDEGRLPITLRLAFPENAQSDHCVKIVSVVANRWLIAD